MGIVNLTDDSFSGDGLCGRAENAISQGLRQIAEGAEMLDPGFGFGKTLGHNLTLLKQLRRFVEMDLPVLVGVSRKSMPGLITGKPVGERIHPSVVAALLAVQRGAVIVRVHDVAATRDALTVLQAIEGT